MRDQRGGIFEIAHQARDIAHEDEPLGVERDGDHRRSDVGVAIVNLAVFAACGRTDHRCVTAPDAFLEWRDVDLDDFADIADVNFLAGIFFVVEVKFPAFENVRAGKSHRLATERIDGGDDLGIDFARKDIVHDLHRGFVGDALALDKVRLEAGFLHRAGDGFAAAVDDDGVDLHRFKKNDVACDAVADAGVGRVHETAAIFDDKCFATEFLDVRQRFEKRRGFGNQVLHVSPMI